MNKQKKIYQNPTGDYVVPYFTHKSLFIIRRAFLLGEEDYYELHSLAQIENNIDFLIKELEDLKEYCIQYKDY